MMLWAGWRWTCPAPRGSPHRLLQHLLGRSLPCCCCSCTVHNPCTRAAAWPTGSWHVSLFSFTWTFILVLQALLPGWTLARPQVPLLLPLHLDHKIRCRLSLLKACITTTSAARNQWFDWHKLCSDATNSQQQPMIATKANDLSKPLLVWPTQQSYWSKTVIRPSRLNQWPTQPATSCTRDSAYSSPRWVPVQIQINQTKPVRVNLDQSMDLQISVDLLDRVKLEQKDI